MAMEGKQQQSAPPLPASGISTLVPPSGRSSVFDIAEKTNPDSSFEAGVGLQHKEEPREEESRFKESLNNTSNIKCSEVPPNKPKASEKFNSGFIHERGQTRAISALAPRHQQHQEEIDFLQVMAWSLIHAGWMHYLPAIFNAHDWTMQYVTTFSADIFSLLNSIIYFHKAFQELQRNHDAASFASFLYSIIGAVGTFLVAVILSTANSWKPLFHRYIRMGLAEYAAAIAIVLFIGIPHISELTNLDQQRLTVQTSFRPTSPDRNVFFVQFWKLPVQWIFISIIPGAIVTILFYFDHEISSMICTIDRYGTKKPSGFAWDIALLGTTTAICGVLGLPPANGLLPQENSEKEGGATTEGVLGDHMV